MEEKSAQEGLAPILQEAAARGASDVHLASGRPVMLRVDGELVRLPGEPLGASEMDGMVSELLPDGGRDELDGAGETEFSRTVPGICRVRASVFRQGGGLAMALRLLPLAVPGAGELGIPDEAMGLAGARRGLVLVAGAAGSGKTTTLAAMVDAISRKCARQIITLERPVEYVHRQGLSMVLTREIGRDSADYEAALRAALHQDPDVIMVGGPCGPREASLAIAAAETGRLVLCAAEADSAVSALRQLAGMFPPQEAQQFLARLSAVLRGVTAQQLIPRREGGGRAAAFEVLLGSPAALGMVREGRFGGLSSLMEVGQKEGMQPMDDAVYELYRKSVISGEAAVSCARDAEGMRRKLSLF